MSTLSLVWVAPGDDGSTGQASAYDIRYSTSLITEQNWDSAVPLVNVPAPRPAGEYETIIVRELPSGTNLYFALKTSDEVPNESALSNCASGATNADGIAPFEVGDLAGKALSDTEVILTWTATGDDGLAGQAAAYDIRYLPDPITEQNWQSAGQVNSEPSPKPSGEPDSCVVTDLTPGTNYHFAMIVADEVPNWSDISNSSPVLAWSKTFWVVPLTIYGDDTLTVFFRTSPPESVEVNVWRNRYEYPYGWRYEMFRHLVSGRFPGGAHSAVWDQTDDHGVPIPENYPVQYLITYHVDGARVDSAYVRRYSAP
jgi:hypothetical protein